MEPVNFICSNEADTFQLAETLALALRPGDLVILSGELGAGKTTLARALIRAAADKPYLEVPSPTFTLVQTYDNLPFGSLAHMDLYRLEDGSELEELGLEEALNNGVGMIEWPEKAKDDLPAPTMSISIQQGLTDDERLFEIKGEDEALLRVKRSMAIRSFLNQNGHQNSARRHLIGDASTRSYEVIQFDGNENNLVLMNSPAMPDGQPVRNGKPYSQIAKLAEDVRPFVGVALALEKQGLHTPHIFAQDLAQGFLLIEDLGRDTILTRDGEPQEARYLACMETLAILHEKKWNPKCPLPDGSIHTIPSFDRDAMMIEVELLSDYYAPHKIGSPLGEKARSEFQQIWSALIGQLEDAEKTLVLRDFHSPNIIWNENATGVARTGLIDFQDALIGPSAYDVASIAQDARVGLSAGLEAKLVDHYCALRTSLDEPSFRKAYAIMAAQRASKVLGIFVRLSVRDKKHIYLGHLPHMEAYFARSLAHPALADYRAWVESVISNNTAE